MDFILYHKRVAKTGRALQNVLQISGGINLVNSDRLIRWGHGGQAEHVVAEINSKKSVLAASHKFNALVTMREKGVSVPHFSRRVEEVKIPAIVRKDSHFGGRGFGLILQKRDAKHWANRGIKDYYIEYMPCHVEYRIHIFAGEVIRVQKKKFMLSDIKNGINHQEARFLRNHGNGWTFHGVKLVHAPQHVVSEAAKAVAALGLHFGAVDVIHGDDDKAYVLEVNTAPGLHTYRSLLRYAERFMSFLGKPVDDMFYDRVAHEAHKVATETELTYSLEEAALDNLEMA